MNQPEAALFLCHPSVLGYNTKTNADSLLIIAFILRSEAEACHRFCALLCKCASAAGWGGHTRTLFSFWAVLWYLQVLSLSTYAQRLYTYAESLYASGAGRGVHPSIHPSIHPHTHKHTYTHQENSSQKSKNSTKKNRLTMFFRFRF